MAQADGMNMNNTVISFDVMAGNCVFVRGVGTGEGGGCRGR